MLTDQHRNAIKSTPVRLDAYEFYIKGHTYLAKKTPDALDAAMGMFETALEFDADYALAYSGLADALVAMYANNGNASLPAARRRRQPARRGARAAARGDAPLPRPRARRC